MEASHVTPQFSDNVSGDVKVEISKIFEQHGQHIGLVSLSTKGMTTYDTDLKSASAVQLDSLITEHLKTIDTALREAYVTVSLRTCRTT